MDPPIRSHFHLPGRHEGRAPSWDGQISTLSSFIRDFTSLCTDYGVHFDDYFTAITLYLPQSEFYVWKATWTRLEPSTRTWDGFLEAIYELYPGSNPERRWTVSDFDQLVQSTSAHPMSTEEGFCQYLRQFMTISQFLIAKEDLTEHQALHAFIRGLPNTLRPAVLQQLRIQQPFHDPYDPWPLDQIRQAAKIVLRSAIYDPDFYIDAPQPPQAPTHASPSSPTTASTLYTLFLDENGKLVNTAALSSLVETLEPLAAMDLLQNIKSRHSSSRKRNKSASTSPLRQDDRLSATANVSPVRSTLPNSMPTSGDEFHLRNVGEAKVHETPFVFESTPQEHRKRYSVHQIQHISTDEACQTDPRSSPTILSDSPCTKPVPSACQRFTSRTSDSLHPNAPRIPVKPSNTRYIHNALQKTYLTASSNIPPPELNPPNSKPPDWDISFKDSSPTSLHPNAPRIPVISLLQTVTLPLLSHEATSKRTATSALISTISALSCSAAKHFGRFSCTAKHTLFNSQVPLPLPHQSLNEKIEPVDFRHR